jgi:transmembrane protein DUF3566
MNPWAGALIVLVAMAAAAYVVVFWRARLRGAWPDAILAVTGATMGVGALLFQPDVSVPVAVAAPLFAAVLVVAHVRGLTWLGVTLPTPEDLPAWLDIPQRRRAAAYASVATTPPRIEEPPVQQQRPTVEQDPELEAMPELDEELAPPLGPSAPAEPGWPETVVGPRTARLPRRGARRARLEVRHVSPLSVLKFSMIFYFCMFLVVYLALAMIWAVLQAAGVIDSLEQLLGQVFPSGTAVSPTGELSTRRAPPLQIDTGQVFTWLFLAGCVGVVIWSLINVFLAVMYNLISDIVGGVEVTLADRRGTE